MLEPSDQVANKASINLLKSQIEITRFSLKSLPKIARQKMLSQVSLPQPQHRHKQGQIVGQITRFAIGLSILGYSVPAVAGTCTVGGGTNDAAISAYVSAEVSNTSSVAQNITNARTFTDALDDDWRAAVAPQTSTSWAGMNTSTIPIPNDNPNLFTINGINVSVSLMNVDNSGNCTGTLNSSSSSPELSSSATLQGGAPRPSSLSGSYWNENTGSSSNRNGVLFTFSQPVSAFGAWFSDLETRTDANGTPAILRLLDAAGNRIGKDIAIAPSSISNNGGSFSTLNQSTCSNSANSCGNNSTRWVGFIDTTARVKQALVIVGDQTTSAATGGNGEHISFIGANLIAANITGTVFEDVNYGGGAGRPLNTPATSPRSGAIVELYDGSGTFKAATTTDSNGVYKFGYTNVSGGIVPGNYTVRVVNSSVTSSRSGYTNALVPVQTFRTNGLNSSNVGMPDPNRVGGEAPQLVDAGNGSLTAAQSISPITVGTAGAAGVDFGFNFDTIVNSNDSGQGSLRQFILNSNALGGESNLAQLNQPAGYETSIFMIPNGVANPGQNTSTGYASQLNPNGIAVINLATALDTISGTNTRLDGATQTINVKKSDGSETNPGQLGTGGTVGIDKISLLTFNRPEIEIKGLYTLTSTGSYNEVKNIAFNANRLVVVGNNALVQHNLVGMQADGTVTAATAGVGGHGIELGAGNDIIARHNYVRVNESGIRRNATGNHLIIENNEVDLPTSGQTNTFDGILLIGSGTNDIIRNNLVKNQKGGGIEVGFSGGTLTNTLIENNTVLHNGYDGANPSTETMGVAAYWLTTNSSVVFRKNVITQSSGPGVAVMNAAGIKLTQNSIFANGVSGNGFGLSIDLDPNTRDPNNYKSSTVNAEGVTPNNGTMLATIPNGGMDYPIFTKAQRSGNTLKVAGYIGIDPLGNTAFANATIEIYKADNSDTNQNGEVIAGDTKSKPHGEGRYYIGTIPTDANGLFDTTLTIPASLTDGITDTTLVATDKITAIATSSATATITPNSTSEFSEDIPMTGSNSNVLLVKRITEVNGSPFNGYEDSASRYDDNTISAPTTLETQSDTDKWPNPPSSFLQGKIDGGTIKPNDSIEYTIYFISAGEDAAKHVFFCDRVPTNVTFNPTTFNSLTPNSAALPGADRGIAIKIGADLKSYTNAGGDDLARYFPPDLEPTYNDYAQFFPGATSTFLAKKICDAPNTNGAIVVNLGTLPNAIGMGNPPESSGFIRFQGKVK
jgi:trimeric autotransporter adhesin